MQQDLVQYLNFDATLEQDTPIPICLRFIASPVMDNSVSQISYEEEWLKSRKIAVKAKNAFWFLVPKLNQEIAMWDRSLANLNQIKMMQFGANDWNLPDLTTLFQEPSTIDFFNSVPTNDPVRLCFENVQTVTFDQDTNEFVVKLNAKLDIVDSTVPLNMRLFNVVFRWLRAFRQLTNGGELTHAIDFDTTHKYGLFLSTRDRLYEILDKGGVSFRVALLEPDAYIYRGAWGADAEEYDGGGDQFVDNPLLLRVPYKRAFVGFNLICDMSRASGASKNRIVGDGNTIVLTLPTKPPAFDRHLVVGQRIYEFRTREQQIARLMSPIGVDGTSFPWLVNRQGNRVFLLNQFRSIRASPDQAMGFGSTPEIVPAPEGELDPYTFLVTKQRGVQMDEIRTKLGVGVLYGFEGSAPLEEREFALDPVPTTVQRKETQEQFQTLDEFVQKRQDKANRRALALDTEKQQVVEHETVFVEPNPWIEQPDGQHKNISRQELQTYLNQITVAFEMLVASQPFYKVRFVESRVLE